MIIKLKNKKIELKHILVDEPTRKNLKIRAVKNDTTIGEIVKKLLKNLQTKEE